MLTCIGPAVNQYILNIISLRLIGKESNLKESQKNRRKKRLCIIKEKVQSLNTSIYSEQLIIRTVETILLKGFPKEYIISDFSLFPLCFVIIPEKKTYLVPVCKLMLLF